jgi:hypothetical protein
MSRIKKRWAETPRPLRVVGYVLLGLVGVAAMGIVFGYAIMLLWNWLMPQLFGVKMITYWQAIGIFALAKLIFGFGFGSGDSKSKKNKKHGKGDDPCENWSDYDTWWETEGKKSFEKYAQAKKEDE